MRRYSKAAEMGQFSLSFIADDLDVLRRRALEGSKYCCNDGCEVVGQPKDFKVCAQCKVFRYCGAACQKQDWTTGGHKEKCGKE